MWAQLEKVNKERTAKETEYFKCKKTMETKEKALKDLLQLLEAKRAAEKSQKERVHDMTRNANDRTQLDSLNEELRKVDDTIALHGSR